MRKSYRINVHTRALAHNSLPQIDKLALLKLRFGVSDFTPASEPSCEKQRGNVARENRSEETGAGDVSIEDVKISVFEKVSGDHECHPRTERSQPIHRATTQPSVIDCLNVSAVPYQPRRDAAAAVVATNAKRVRLLIATLPESDAENHHGDEERAEKRSDRGAKQP